MTKETAVIELGIKGKDIVMSTLNKANAQKDKLTKVAKAAIGTGGAVRTQPTPQTAAAVQAAEEKHAREESKLATIAKNTGSALMGLANSMSGLDPTSFMTGITSAGAKALSSIPYFGGTAEGAAELTNVGIKMATGAVAASKTAANVETETQGMRGHKEFFGKDIFTQGTFFRPMRDKLGEIIKRNGKPIMEAFKADRYGLSEEAGIVDQLGAKFGKYAGTNFEKSVKRLFANAPDIGQATAVASGQFSALGTDKGFFMEKIASGFYVLPPTFRQELMSQMHGMIDPATGLMHDAAEGSRASRAGFETSERSKQSQIFSAYADNAGRIQSLNISLGTMEANLVRTGASLTGLVNTFAGAINDIAAKAKGAKGKQ